MVELARIGLAPLQVLRIEITVDSPGIEPGPRQCEWRVVPLDYEPKLKRPQISNGVKCSVY